MARKNDKLVNRLIMAAIDHNEKVNSVIREIQSDSIKNIMDKCNCSRDEACSSNYGYYYYFKSCSAVEVFYNFSKKKIVSNIIRSDSESKDDEINRNIKKLNESFDTVRNDPERRWVERD